MDPEDAHQGGVITSQNYPVQELGRKRGGGRIFEGGVLARHYGICIVHSALGTCTHESTREVASNIHSRDVL